MAISTHLYNALKSKTGWSAATISRKADALRREHGPMTPDQARYIIAHERGIDLRKFLVPQTELAKVQALRASGATLSSSPVAVRRVARERPPAARRPRSPTPKPPSTVIPATPSVMPSSRSTTACGR